MVVTVRYSGADGLTRHYCSEVSPPINTGVPQGSNLGPVLLNDLPQSVTEDLNKDLLRCRAQEGLNEMSKWCQENKLLLNKGKTKALMFYNRKKPDSAPLLRLEGASIAVDESVKYLGWLNHKQ
ncbi:hypothetical protein J6590_033262 [Homalodisca vitripennis]|nr:hypothetical protein J6590_033262 [Homalodisca vitripennis]